MSSIYNVVWLDLLPFSPCNSPHVLPDRTLATSCLFSLFHDVFLFKYHWAQCCPCVHEYGAIHRSSGVLLGATPSEMNVSPLPQQLWTARSSSVRDGARRSYHLCHIWGWRGPAQGAPAAVSSQCHRHAIARGHFSAVLPVFLLWHCFYILLRGVPRALWGSGSGSGWIWTPL